MEMFGEQKIEKKKYNNSSISITIIMPKIAWARKAFNAYNAIKKGPIVFFGNEFFDAIPIKKFLKF